MSPLQKLIGVLAVVILASLYATPLALSQDWQSRFAGSSGRPDHDDSAKDQDHSRCREDCQDTDCPNARGDDGDDGQKKKDGAGCESQCPKAYDCDELAILPQYTAIASAGAAHFRVRNRERKDLTWSASIGTIDDDGDYIAPTVPESTTATVTATSNKHPAESATATVHIVAPGQVSPTANGQVAMYSISPGAPANVSVRFGPDTNYALRTWEQPVPDGGSPVNILVAGMMADATYHMKAVVKFSDGARFEGYDNMFVTAPIPAGQLPKIAVTTSPGLHSQTGVELLDMLVIPPQPAPLVLATDLDGNVVWSYTDGTYGGDPQPIKLLPNGHFLIIYAGGVGTGGSLIQEVDLAGNLIWQLTLPELNASLAAATCAGCNVKVTYTHHDFAPLPNGHLLVIGQVVKMVSGVTLFGDVVIDLDPNHKPVWIWNEFDHLDTNRRPFGFTLGYPDWTHTNAILYSPDDGNFMVSVRHQNWLIKVDYRNGNGTGDILWRLGYQGDFQLIGGVDPTDWFYAQHGPSFHSKSTFGIFTLALFDNGDDRVFPPGVTCDAMGAPACLYSTVPILQIDETAMTATLVSNRAATGYSFFGGNAEVLKNGNLEFCETDESGPDFVGNVYEVLQGSDTQTVWHLNILSQSIYRGMRLPSLYPGVSWGDPEDAMRSPGETPDR